MTHEGTVLSDVRIDPDVSVTEAVVDAVAAVEGADPTELPPLYGTVDPDALDRLFASAAGDGTTGVGFEYAGRRVEVCDEGRVVVRES